MYWSSGLKKWKQRFIISPNEVFGDIMVLALPPRPPPRPPKRREHSNSKSIQPISFKFYMRVDTPLRFFAIEIWYPPRTRTTAGFIPDRENRENRENEKCQGNVREMSGNFFISQMSGKCQGTFFKNVVDMK